MYSIPLVMFIAVPISFNIGSVTPWSFAGFHNFIIPHCATIWYNEAMKKIDNDYRLKNGNRGLEPSEIREAFSHFEYFMANCQQIVNKDRQLVPFKLNEFQRRLFSTILPMVHKETRIDKRHSIIVVKSRQVGASVGITALINYLCAFADLQNINIAHVFPVGDTISKFYQQKVLPIISGVHPSIFPTMERETLSSSIMTHYKDIKGIPLNNYYELISSGSDSIRSSTINILLEDEVCYYKKPEKLESAILPALPDTGFSLLVYLSTVGEDASSIFFLEKLKIALDNPDDWTVVFAPWFFTYPERAIGVEYDSLILDEYESETLVPAFMKEGLPRERWGDCIAWYRKRMRDFNNNRKRMQLEYPSNLNEVLTINSDRMVFNEKVISAQLGNLMPGKPYKITTDIATGKVAAVETDVSPFTIFKPPIFGHLYRIAIDPITAQSQDTDNFVMQVMDMSNHEQVAVFRDRGLQDEDYADWAVSIGTIYNKAQLCPESNVANGFIVAVNARRYYRWWYQDKKNKSDRIPGIRTTVSSKEKMVDSLETLLNRGNIIIHDEHTIEELTNFVRIVKQRTDGSSYVRVAARAGHHDDDIAALWIYAGSLDLKQIEGRKHSGFAMAW